MKKIQLEDKGQDLLYFIVDETTNEVVEAGPFHNELYKGAYIPLESQFIGDSCAIHSPPHINYGFLKYKVTSIENYKQHLMNTVTIHDLWSNNKKHYSFKGSFTPAMVEKKYRQYLKEPEGTFEEYMSKTNPDMELKNAESGNYFTIEIW